MTLSQDLALFCANLSSKTVTDPQKVKLMLTQLNFGSRLIEDLLDNVDDKVDLNGILDELQMQNHVWVDDESRLGNIVHLKTLLEATEACAELLPMYQNLLESLLNAPDPGAQVERPKLPDGLIQQMCDTFECLDWNECRVFLSYLSTCFQKFFTEPFTNTNLSSFGQAF